MEWLHEQKITWQRPDPSRKLFDLKIWPQEIKPTNLFSSVLAALAEKPSRIASLFKKKPEGSGQYVVKLRGREVMVDDWFPVGREGEPAFGSTEGGEIWLPVLEKVWAKLNGSY